MDYALRIAIRRASGMACFVFGRFSRLRILRSSASIAYARSEE
jgi:hypothetical protein